LSAHLVAAAMMVMMMMTLPLLPLSRRFLRALAVVLDHSTPVAAGAAAADLVSVGHRNGAAMMSVVMSC